MYRVLVLASLLSTCPPQNRVKPHVSTEVLFAHISEARWSLAKFGALNASTGIKHSGQGHLVKPTCFCGRLGNGFAQNNKMISKCVSKYRSSVEG